jgi:hypothetical protein
MVLTWFLSYGTSYGLAQTWQLLLVLLGDGGSLGADPWQERDSVRLLKSQCHLLILLSWKSLEQVRGVPALETVWNHIKIVSVTRAENFVAKKGDKLHVYFEKSRNVQMQFPTFSSPFVWPHLLSVYVLHNLSVTCKPPLQNKITPSCHSKFLTLLSLVPTWWWSKQCESSINLFTYRVHHTYRVIYHWKIFNFPYHQFCGSPL